MREFNTELNEPVTFEIGDWVNSEGETPEISDAGIFTIPAELVEVESESVLVMLMEGFFIRFVR